jgi:hypothetical protein
MLNIFKRNVAGIESLGQPSRLPGAKAMRTQPRVFKSDRMRFM